MFDAYLSLPEIARLVDSIEEDEQRLEKQFEGRLYDPEFYALVKKNRLEKIFSFWRLAKWNEFVSPTAVIDKEDFFVTMIVVCGFGVYGIGVVVSLLFPFFSFGLYLRSQTLFQMICLGVMVAFLLGALVLLPTFVRYLMFCREIPPVLSVIRKAAVVSSADFHQRCLQEAAYFINQYHQPSTDNVLCSTIPWELVPVDVIPTIGAFLLDGDILLDELSLGECEALREQMIF